MSAWVRLGLFCMMLMLLSGCRDKPLPEVLVRPVLFTEITDTRQDLRRRFAGSIQPRDEAALSFRVAGRIATRQVEVGQWVRQGELLATLEPSDQRHQVRTREAELNTALASWKQLRDEQQHYRYLIERGVGAQARLDRISSDLRTQETMLSQARLVLQQANDQLSYTRLLAEFEGVVTEWQAEVGQVVATGHAVVSLARPQSREAVVDLPVELAAALDADLQIKVFDALDGQSFVMAQVRQLSPQIDATTRTRRVRLSLSPLLESFRLGSMVNVEISSVTASFRELPGSAVFERDGQAQVWVIDPQTSTLSVRAVQVLAHHGTAVRVSGQLQGGDKVVIAGVDGLKKGQRVRMQRMVSL